MSRIPFRLAACCLAILNFWSSAAMSQTSRIPLPDGTLAFWSMDPGAAGAAANDPNRQLLETGLIALIERVLVLESGSCHQLAPLLESRWMQGAPYRLLLLDLEVASDQEPDARVPVRLKRLQAILQIQTAEHHSQFVAALIKTRKSPKEAVQEWELPGGRVAQGFRGPEDADELSWMSLEDSFLVGFGKGALEHAQSAVDRGPWKPHRDLVHRTRPNSRPVLQAFVDLDRLRQLIPDQMGWGTPGELLHAWRISNARSAMVHILAPPLADAQPSLLQLDLTWSSRAQPTGQVRGHSLSLDQWPPELGPAPYLAEDVAYTLILPTDWPWWLGIGLDTYAALGPDNDFSRDRREWLRRNAGLLDATAAVLAGTLAIVGYSGQTDNPSLLIPGRPGIQQQMQGAPQRLLAALPNAKRLSSQDGWVLNLGGEQVPLHLHLQRSETGITGTWISGTGVRKPGSEGDDR